MLDFLLQRSTVIALALAGGALSIIASFCGTRGAISAQTLKILNKAAYTFMAVSMILFVAAGLLRGGSG